MIFSFKLLKKSTFSYNSAKKILCLIFLCFLSTTVFCQERISIDYYGIIADNVDDNMSKMASDLYYSQLCEINNYSVSDKRSATKMTSIPDNSIFSQNRFSIYAVITKKENSSKWISTITLYDFSKQSNFSEAKEYDSFYKILMEPKASLQNTITTLLSSFSTSNNTAFKETSSDSSKNIQSTEFLSGTWGGEDSIDKIVIMRGGRGFVIFKNGASMNITVELSNQGSKQNIIISQNGKSNASFLTELPREVALKEAVNAKPIQWVLQANDDNTLTGIKSTLIQSNGNTIDGTLDVVWKRKS